MEQPVPQPRIHSHHHAVQFYGSDKSLFTTVAGFLSEGLVAGQPAIVIATESHREAIVEHLTRRLIDVAQAQRIGDFVLLDARELLTKFMVDGSPDHTLFELHVGGIIETTLRGRSRTIVRAYGEMVDVLWKDGRSDAAIMLEMFWNRLSDKYGFALLCGYAMGSFYKQAKLLEDVCDQHTHVISEETNVVSFEPRRQTA